MTSFKKYAPYLALAMGVLALSLSSLFIRWAKAPGMITSFYRMTIAAVILTPVYFNRPGPRKALTWGVLPLVILAAFFSAIDHAVWSTAIGMTRVANATLLNNLAPLWVALFAAIFWREKLGGKFWGALALTLAGAVVVLGNDLIKNPHLSLGDFLAVLSSLAYAGFFLTTQKSRRVLPTLAFIWVVDIFCALFLLIANRIFGNSLAGYPLTTYLAFLGAALISQAFGYFSVTYALGRLPAAVVSPTMIAQPVLTALLAIPLVGESLSPSQWVGGITVLVGIYLVNRFQKQEETPGL